MKQWRVWLMLILLLAIGISVQAQTETITVPDDPVRWDGESVFTILVMGIDERPSENLGMGTRTDAIFIVRIDPINETVGILHIPRDLFMGSIDDIGEELLRVNTLVLRGENRQEGYGAFYAIETLQYNFGLYIDAYLAIDFTAFETFIDAIGGVTVEVPYTIYDPTYPDMNYGYDPFYLPRGTHTLDGHRALQYARTRHQDNDYLRGQRQLQVIEAIQVQLSNPRILTQLVSQAPELYSDLYYHIYSNIPPENMLTIGLALMQADDLTIHTGSVNQQYSYPYTYRGDSVRVPDRETLPSLLIQVFGEDYWR